MKHIKNTRDESQPATWISIIAGAVNEWRSQHKWSRETVVNEIVETHLAHGQNTNIKFEAKSDDVYQRQHTNANKVFRWLDELTKDTNLLPANFIYTILSSLPMVIRLRTVNTMLTGLDISASEIRASEVEQEPLEMLRHIMVETSDVTTAYAQLIDGIDPGELDEAEATTKSAIVGLEQALKNIHALQTHERQSVLKAVK